MTRLLAECGGSHSLRITRPTVFDYGTMGVPVFARCADQDNDSGQGLLHSKTGSRRPIFSALCKGNLSLASTMSNANVGGSEACLLLGATIWRTLGLRGAWGCLPVWVVGRFGFGQEDASESLDHCPECRA